MKAKLGTLLSNISLLLVLEESKLLTEMKFCFITCLSESDNLNEYSLTTFLTTAHETTL